MVRRWLTQASWMFLALGVFTSSSDSATRVAANRQVSFSHKGGFADKPFKLILTAEPPPGCSIRYTRDGSAPSAANGELFTNAIAVSNTVVIRAAAFSQSSRVSPVLTHTFLFLDDVI